MNILFISWNGEGVGLCQRLQTEGHNVYFYSQTPEVGEGLIKRVKFKGMLISARNSPLLTGINKVVEEIQPNLVVALNPLLGKVLATFAGKGIPTFGGSEWSYTFSTDPSYSHSVLTLLSLSLQSSNNYGYSFLWNGLEEHLSHLYYDDDRLMTGDVGPKVLTMGCSIKPAPKIKIDFLKTVLGKSSYRGFVNLVLNRKTNQPVALNFEPTLEHLYAFLELYKNGSISQLLNSVAVGGQPQGKLLDQHALSVRLVNGRSSETIIEGLCVENEKHIWWHHIQKINKEVFALPRREICSITARGEGLKGHDSAGRRAYRTISRLKINDVMFRTDIGHQASSLLY